ncbi:MULTISPECIES: N-acyl-D-amino-acid deacylase family protein [unclassified Sphingomonas]|uniref:N-acyl-D-amino-acid deacylase family protein n=2 Tax=Sphingomonas TaxID=13687 RepID=UPI0006F87FC9|nr:MULTISPECIES: amidohydrolase family protein [unclassified Sphingomonas]KQX18581.1 amidohydrolase [Sphingomonas sp. Root1294]KQY72095.1 amidohydrolase [Sphingomonas sp. Root50]KRB94635.1 amidohydrolase [Sphingomonas sp. Root720]
MLDMVIRNGLMFDGRGSAPVRADIAISGDRIVQVGVVDEKGREEIDAAGRIVTPGWVDIHTHYDGQITWDARVTPSSTLGATTVVTGNCGVGFAPVRPGDRDTLIRLMEGVEDIPGSALSEGMSWDWESFLEYMDAVERLPHDIDVAVQVPHGALRVYVMGDRGANRSAATDAENQQMRAYLRDAIRAGALGFTTTRTILHRTADGDYTPTFRAARAEMEAIAGGMADARGGVMQCVSDFYHMEEEFQLMRDLTRISGQPLTFSLIQAEAFPDQWRELLTRLEAAVADGYPIKAQVAGRPVGLMLGLQGSAHPFISRPSFIEILDKPLAEKVAIMRDPAFRAKLVAEKPLDGHPFINSLVGAYDKIYLIKGDVDYEPDPATSVGARAKAAGVNPEEIVYDALLADEGRAFLFFPMQNYHEGNLDNVRTMLTHPDTLSALSDGGAHVGAICDVSLPTFMLTHWCRDRSRGPLLDLAETIHAQTSETAEAVGLLDRGVIAPGYLADINVIDFDRLKLSVPYMVYDLPTGARRLMQDAEGYVATIKSGKVIYRDGQATGELPGRLVRGAQGAPDMMGA